MKFVGLALAGVLLGLPAHASMTLCNRTSYILYAAVASATQTDLVSHGWDRIVAGACSLAIPADLTAPNYFVYARSSQAHLGPQQSWGGATSVCVKDQDFTIHDLLTLHHCDGSDTLEMPFARIDTHHLINWTMTFSEGTFLVTLQDARRAGIKRLLVDVGYHIAAISAGPDTAADRALGAFERRMHVSKAAGDTGLFDALETAALKNAAPQGYSICNDTAKPVVAALGHKDGASWVSHGWWQIAPGHCAHALTVPLVADSYYLFVQRVAGGPLVKGKDIFCTTTIEFDIENRDNCAARGLVSTGFLKTPISAHSSFVAHVAENGLVTQPAR